MRRLLPLLALLSCTSADGGDFGSGWSMGANLRPDDVESVIPRTEALVDSLVSEGFRITATDRSTTSDRDGAHAGRSWELRGRHPEIGPIRIYVDATTDPAAENHLRFRVRFASGDAVNAARDAFQRRVLAIAHPAG